MSSMERLQTVETAGATARNDAHEMAHRRFPTPAARANLELRYPALAVPTKPSENDH
jgi:hypothetical protein